MSANCHAVLFLSDRPYAFNPWITLAQNAGLHVLTHTLSKVEDCESVDVAHADIIIEWCPLQNGLKPEVLSYLAQTTAAEVPILSACWERPATTLARWFELKNRLIGFSPLSAVQETKGVTLVPPYGGEISGAMFERISGFFQQVQLTPYWLNKDTPVGVAPRIWAMLVNEAAHALQEGVASAEDIDTAMKLGTNYPMGPCAWADMVGVETVLDILDTLWSVYRDERYRPCWLLQQMAQAGHTGKIAGKGFFTYETAGAPAAIAPQPSHCH